MMMLPSSPESSQNNPLGLEWGTLPDLILSDILMKVGLNRSGLGDLYRCSQVCSKWSKMILRDICQRENKMKNIRERVGRDWGPDMLPTNDEISGAKWAGEGCLTLKFIANINLL